MNKKIGIFFGSLLFTLDVTADATPALAFGGCTVPQVLIPDGVQGAISTFTGEINSASYGAGSLAPLRACGHYSRGLIYHEIGDLDAAIADYTGALELEHEFPEALVARGDAYMELKESDKAVADYSAAESFKSNARAYYDECWARILRGHSFDLALASCNAAVALNPTNSFDLQSRCVVNYRLGNYKAAIADCSAALGHVLDVVPDRSGIQAASYYPRGIAELKTGDTAAGNADIAQAVRYFPKIAESAKGWGVKP